MKSISEVVKRILNRFDDEVYVGCVTEETHKRRMSRVLAEEISKLKKAEYERGRSEICRIWGRHMRERGYK